MLRTAHRNNSIVVGFGRAGSSGAEPGGTQVSEYGRLLDEDGEFGWTDGWRRVADGE